MNRLQHETSPYLLQHAHNPVDWYAWKSEALERAKQEDKPILVSIGYSTCHWCHVMERESFEDEATAAFMNEHFINIKIDREERPDLDKIYMEACQAINGSGGWPLNCFLMPDGRPYFAGTYYPPQPAHQRPSWSQVLRRMAEAWKEQRDVVEKQAERLMYSIQQSSEIFIKDDLLEQREELYTPILAQEIYFALDKRLDKESGGFGGAPKFPGTMGLEWLLDYYHATGNEDALAAVEFSAQKMIRGGLYDQLGGGFARYATDRDWKVPHFEKMLYDNALLLRLLAGIYQTNPKEIYKRTIEETLEFVAREMSLEDGGFYSALDADSEGVEGKFYLWTTDEVRNHLGLGPDTELFIEYYQMEEAGNWEGSNILWAHPEPAKIASQFGLSEEEMMAKLETAKAILFPIRAKRIRPGLDDKSLLDWNSLMVTAYARVAKALNDPSLKELTEKHINKILSIFFDPGQDLFLHSYKDGQAQYQANLSDYAFLIEALLEVYSLNFNLSYLERAAQLCQQTLDEFLDQDTKQFYFTAAGQTDLPIRSKDVYDSALPNGGSTMVHNLLKLSLLLDRPNWRQLAEDILQPMAAAVVKYPSSFARWAQAILYQIYPGSEIAIVGKNAFAKAADLQKHYLPGSVMMAASKENKFYPLLADRGEAANAKIYVCQHYSCQLPVEETEAALAQMKK